MEPNREKLLNFIKSNGPVLPVQVSKFLNTNIIFAGAMLSELVSNNHVLVTNTKKGGSPFYYTKGQEPKLASLGTYLSGKEKEAFELLYEKKVVKDSEALPWQRVALRAIKDFAFPIEVEFQGTKELFWKWYMVGNEELNSKLSEILNTNNYVEEEIKETPEETKLQEIENNFSEEKLLEPELLEKQEDTQTNLIQDTVKKHKKTTKKIKKEDSGIFDNNVLEYLHNSKIKIIEKTPIKVNKETDYIVNVPTNFGDIKFFLKSKNKLSINESDLALAYSSGQQKKLHTLLLSNGSLTKKAKEYLENHLNGQITFINLESLK